jgi:hypothetical protein
LRHRLRVEPVGQATMWQWNWQLLAVVRLVQELRQRFVIVW